jgi:ADP-ribose pyrophosphatase YjhB (NUDIX family)
MAASKTFNIRVYGILENAAGELMISQERYRGWEIIKFPGGGLEWGEGVVDGLRREMREELGLEVAAPRLVHVTEGFVPSAFSPTQQVIAIHYGMRLPGEVQPSALLHVRPEPQGTGAQILQRFWIKPQDWAADRFTFPIDQEAFRRYLQQRF